MPTLKCDICGHTENGYGWEKECPKCFRGTMRRYKDNSKQETLGDKE